jgi:hypothetical protein
MQPSDGEIQRRLRAYASPCYGYRRAADGTIEKDLFDGVRPEGWADSPAAVGEAPTWKRPPAKEASDTDGTEATMLPPYGHYGFKELRAEIKRRAGKGPVPGTTTKQMIAMLEALDAPE